MFATCMQEPTDVEKWVSDSPQLDLQVFVNPSTGAEKQTQSGSL